MITSDLNHRTETEAHLQKGADWLLACYLEGAAKRQTLDVFMRADADARFESAQIAARQGDTARVRTLLEPVFAAARMSLFIVPEDNPIADVAYVEEKAAVLEAVLSGTADRNSDMPVRRHFDMPADQFSDSIDPLISGTTADPAFSASVSNSADAVKRDAEQWAAAKKRFKPVSDRLYRELDGRDFFAARSELKRAFLYLWQRCKPFMDAVLPEAAGFYRLSASLAPVFHENHRDPEREMLWIVPVRDAVFQSTGATPDALDLYRFLVQPHAQAVSDGGDVWGEIARTLTFEPEPLSSVAALLERIRMRLPRALHILSAYRTVLPFCHSDEDFGAVAAFFKETLARSRRESFIIRKAFDNEFHLVPFPGLHTVFLEFDKNPSSLPLFETEPLRSILPASVLSNQDSALRFRLRQESKLADVLESDFEEHAAAFFIRTLLSCHLPDDETLRLKTNAYLSVLRSLGLADDGTAAYDGLNPEPYHRVAESGDAATDMKNRACLDKMRDLMRSLSGSGDNHANGTTVQIRTIESFLLPILHHVTRAGEEVDVNKGKLEHTVLSSSFDRFDIKRMCSGDEDYYPITNRNAYTPARLPHAILNPELRSEHELEALLMVEWQYYFSRFLSDLAGYVEETDKKGGWVPDLSDCFGNPMPKTDIIDVGLIQLPSFEAKKQHISLNPRDREYCEARLSDLRRCVEAIRQSAQAWGLERFNEGFWDVDEWSKKDADVTLPILFHRLQEGEIFYSRRDSADKLTGPSAEQINEGVPVAVRKMPSSLHIEGRYALGLFADFDKNVEHAVWRLKGKRGGPLPSVAQGVFKESSIKADLRIQAIRIGVYDEDYVFSI